MRLRTLFFLSSTVINFSIFGAINQKHDKQVWLQSAVRGEISDTLSVQLREELRWGNDASRLYTQITELFLYYQPFTHVQFGGGYRNTTRLGSTTTKEWFQAYSGIGTITFLYQANKWKFANRNWGQRETFPIHEIKDIWIYRNRTTITTPIQMITPKMPLYIYDEVFFAQGTGFYENRFGAGFFINWTEHTTGFIEGMYRRVKIAHIWRPQTVFNFSFSFSF